MSPLSQYIVLMVLLISMCSNSSDSDIYSCPRIRKAWHLTTEKEKQLFITGIHQLNDEGKFKYFATTHYHELDSNQAHHTAAFFAWHRYFLWEFENQIRRLGPEYECFSIPFWDPTNDYGLYDAAYIFHSGLGAVGGITNDNQCVGTNTDASWSINNFPLDQSSCELSTDPTDDISNACCLKRASGYSELSSISSYTHLILTHKTFGTTNGFRDVIFTKYHSELHSFVGGIWGNYTHMTSKYSSQDPLFYLIHSWLDYIFIVWKQCHGYNSILSSDLDQYVDAYAPSSLEQHIPASGLDDVLYYVPMNDVLWWEGKWRNPTVRSLWDETQWNIKYERGTFIEHSHLSTLCDHEWDSNILLPNELVSDANIYERMTWDVVQKMMDAKDDLYSESDYIQSWEAKICNFGRQIKGKQSCYVPQIYGKCTEEDYDRRDEITLDEMLSKEGVKGNQCLEEVRIQNYAWAKTMNMVYELCLGEMDKYFVCDAPIIEFIVDLDDELYYKTMWKNKEKMKQEALVQMNANIKEIDTIEQDSNIVNEIGNYPRFDVLGYLIVAFMIGGCAFIYLIVNCAAECTTKMQYSKEYHDRDCSLSYGSLIEML